MQRVAIIGLGLIGGSIGLALKQASLPDVTIVGVARSRDTASRARKLGAIDEEARDAARAVHGASLVIVAPPVLSVRSVFEEIAPALEEGVVVTDVASTKADVLRWAEELLPPHAHFVGGHPMAGKEQSGIEAADANLFRGKPWVIVPSLDAPEGAVNAIIGLAQLAGAEPVFMDALEHDSYVAAVSHLPLVVSTALFSVASGSTAWPELAALASSGFRDTTRLASGSPEMAHDIVRTNRANIIHWLDRMQAELTAIRGVIERSDSTEIAERFARAQIERDTFVQAGPPRREVPGEHGVPRVNFMEFLLGSKVADMMRRQEELIRAAEKRAERRP